MGISRRNFLTGAGATSMAALLSTAPVPMAIARPPWPAKSAWDRLSAQVGGRLIAVASPLQPCIDSPAGQQCTTVLADLQNPFFNEDQPGATQTTGWADAWNAAVSPYAVAAQSADDVAAAIRFARQESVRIVVKGTGHDYLGRSNAPDSLLIWTHNMRDVEVHDNFQIVGGDGTGWPAISVGAGTRWLEAYVAATQRGRYVQGGGCTSVGAAGGFIQGSGFGSFSRRYGTGAAGVLEYEVVTAEGTTVIANDAQNQDLFWALRGGGGGTFGVVTRATLLTHDIPYLAGLVTGSIIAHNDQAFRALIGQLVDFYPTNLNNPHWGEQIALNTDNTLQLGMTFLDLTEAEARQSWQPLLDWVHAQPDSFTTNIAFTAFPFDKLWDVSWWQNSDPGFITPDPRPNQPATQYWWSTNQGEVSAFIRSYQSRWLPLTAFDDTMADALFAASRQYHCALHFNKALAGADPDALARTRRTSINPAALDAAALLICSSSEPHAYPGVPGHEPDLAEARARTAKINAAMAAIRAATPDSGSYLNEADYFEPNWQRSFWGQNYDRLLDIKRKYDPDNLFRVHHGVGSES